MTFLNSAISLEPGSYSAFYENGTHREANINQLNIGYLPWTAIHFLHIDDISSYDKFNSSYLDKRHSNVLSHASDTRIVYNPIIIF